MKNKEKIRTRCHLKQKAKNPKKIAAKNWILRFGSTPLNMTIPAVVLAIILTFVIISKSQAAECINYSGGKVTCIEKLADENGANSCGTNCTFKLIEENGKQVLHIYKTDASKPASIREGAFSPNYYTGEQVLDAKGDALPLQNIVLDNDFETIENYAFSASGANISSASGKFVFDVNSNLYYAINSTIDGDIEFKDTVRQTIEKAKVNEDVIISENVNQIIHWAFNGSKINGNLIIPATIKEVGDETFTNLTISGKVYCAAGVDACYEMIKRDCGNSSNCLTYLDELFNEKKFSDYPDGCAKLGAKAVCTKCKSENFRLNDGECDRLRYTPAEAAAVMNGDDNTIIITFRK